MIDVTRKSEVGILDGTPEKRMFWSIISDYDLKTGLCELVDNALDLWMSRGRRQPLRIDVTLDIQRQLILVRDNAGGVKEQDMRLLIAPGGSNQDPSAEVIGTFGVGSKRAGIALGERVEIRTRFGRGKSLQVEISRAWLESDDWELPEYEVPEIARGTTEVEISHLRKAFSDFDVARISDHLGETYDWFLKQNCVISVNDSPVEAHSFETWAYPPGFDPRRAAFNAMFGKDGKVAVHITAGLIIDRVPERDNYGVYFYCNHRLIVKELKTHEVGYFVTSEAGVPHPDASLCRVIVRLQGPAQLMPWNSSKSGINYGHDAFQQVRPTLIPLVSHFSSLSRRLKDDWTGKVFRYNAGEVRDIEPAELSEKRMVLPPLPRVRKARVERLKQRNKREIGDMPWTLGIVEAMGAVDIIVRQKLETKNRIALILLDSNFEIALKEFIVHRKDLFPANQFNDARIHSLFASGRQNVINTVLTKVSLPRKHLAKAQHYYTLRNKLIHERATVGILDSDVSNYRKTIEAILKVLFGLRL
jgi:hypothetical protein